MRAESCEHNMQSWRVAKHMWTSRSGAIAEATCSQTASPEQDTHGARTAAWHAARSQEARALQHRKETLRDAMEREKKTNRTVAVRKTRARRATWHGAR